MVGLGFWGGAVAAAQCRCRLPPVPGVWKEPRHVRNTGEFLTKILQFAVAGARWRIGGDIRYLGVPAC